MNLHRRQLNASQLSLIGTKSMESFEREAKERQGTRTDLMAQGPQSKNHEPLSRDKVAETVGVSGRSIARAKRITKEGAKARFWTAVTDMKLAFDPVSSREP